MQLSHLSGLIGYLDSGGEKSGYWKLGSTVCSVHPQMTVGICSVELLIRQEP